VSGPFLLNKFLSCNIIIVKTLELLGQTVTPDDTVLKLILSSDECILANGKSLMSSRIHGSEKVLARFACARGRSSSLACSLDGQESTAANVE